MGEREGRHCLVMFREGRVHYIVWFKLFGQLIKLMYAEKRMHPINYVQMCIMSQNNSPMAIKLICKSQPSNLATSYYMIV